MKPAAPPPDADRDAWLSQALRHAPDADVAPPPSLSELILREAQAKAKPAASPAPPPVAPPVWSRAWDWMARPAVGASLASVMLASLVGVMMWNRPLEEMSPRPAVEVAAAPAPATAPSPVPSAQSSSAVATAAAPDASTAVAATGSATAISPDKAAADVAQRPERVADAAKTKQSAEAAATLAAKQTEAMERKRADESERRAEPSKLAADLKEERARPALKAAPDALAKAARTAEAMSPAPPVVEAVVRNGTDGPVATMPAAAPPARKPAAMPGLATAPAPSSVAAPAPALPPVAAPAPQHSNNRNAAEASASGQVAPPSRQAADASASASPSASRFAAGGLAAVPAGRSFVNLRASLAAEPAPWTWSRDGAAPRQVDDSIAAFLADVDGVAASRWQSASVAAVEAAKRSTASAETASGSATRDKLEASPSAASDASRPSVRSATVRLLRHGQPAHILRLDGHVLRWDRLGPDAASAEVTLSDAELQTVRTALDKLAP